MDNIKNGFGNFYGAAQYTSNITKNNRSEANHYDETAKAKIDEKTKTSPTNNKKHCTMQWSLFNCLTLKSKKDSKNERKPTGTLILNDDMYDSRVVISRARFEMLIGPKQRQRINKANGAQGLAAINSEESLSKGKKASEMHGDTFDIPGWWGSDPGNLVLKSCNANQNIENSGMKPAQDRSGFNVRVDKLDEKNVCTDSDGQEGRRIYKRNRVEPMVEQHIKDLKNSVCTSSEDEENVVENGDGIKFSELPKTTSVAQYVHMQDRIRK